MLGDRLIVQLALILSTNTLQPMWEIREKKEPNRTEAITSGQLTTFEKHVGCASSFHELCVRKVLERKVPGTRPLEYPIGHVSETVVNLLLG